jgi:hypothetical protein
VALASAGERSRSGVGRVGSNDGNHQGGVGDGGGGIAIVNQGPSSRRGLGFGIGELETRGR